MAIVVNVTKKASKKFYQARWIDPVTGKMQTQSTKTAVKREADRFAADLGLQLEAGDVVKRAKITWAEFRKRYVAEAMADNAESTIERVGTVLNAVEQIINPQAPGSIQEEQLADLVAEWRKPTRAGKTELSPVTIDGNLGMLRTALRWAKSEHMIHRVPKFPKRKTKQALKRRKQSKGRPITLEEFERLLKVVPAVVMQELVAREERLIAQLEKSKTERGKAFYSRQLEDVRQRQLDYPEIWRRNLWGLWWSGLRLSEFAELHWQGNEIRPILDGRRPMFWIGHEGQKSGLEEFCPMAPEFAEFLEQVPVRERKGYVFDVSPFTQRRGDNISPFIRAFGREAKIVVKTGKETKYASAHDLRRSFGSRWALRVRPFVLKELMRHESIATTEEYYAELETGLVCDELWKAIERTDVAPAPGKKASAD